MKRLRLLICFSATALLVNTAKAITPLYDTLVPLGSTWKYLDNGLDGPTNWKTLTFSDGSWASGPAPLGFGDPWIITCIHSGCGTTITCTPTCSTITITDYFRKQITIPSISAYDSVSMDAQIDDGIIMYVNGTEVWSFNMPSTWDYTTVTDSIIQGAEETTLQHITIPMTAFVNGNNQVAIELHQRGPTTSDATLDVRMRFKHAASASVNNILNSEAQFSLYPNPSNGNFTIETSNAAFSNEDVNLSLFDIAGRKITEGPVQFVQGKTSQNLSLNPGMYFVHLTGANSNASFKVSISK